MKKVLTIILLVIVFFGCRKEKQIDPPGKKSSNNYLSAGEFDKLHIELVYAAGMEPTDGAVTALKSFLEKHLNKPSGIEITRKVANTAAKEVYSFQDLQDLEKSNRSANNGNRTITAYIFFAGGAYDQNSGNSKILGIAYGGSSIVIFEKTIREYSGGLTQPSVQSVEASVLNHEFGHLLGLVNNGTEMVSNHQDEPHGKHCNNTKCLMYYATETSDFIANILNNNVPDLDENCVKDLQANGGK